jgi:DNA polymerase I-like protein with 3'-5' exonuclease and polymerase domains
VTKIHLQYTNDDTPYLGVLKTLIGGKCEVSINSATPAMLMEVVLRAKSNGASYIATTSPLVLQFLLGKKGDKLPSLDKYAGSIFDRYGFEWLILDPLETLVTRPWGRFWHERCWRKFLGESSDWLQIPEFRWQVFSPADTDALSEMFLQSTFIACDIETLRDDPDRSITCISFTGVQLSTESRSYTALTVVVPFTDEYNIQFVRTIIGFSNPKVFQNGKYDIAYLLRYNILPTNYSFDTINLFHSWYSELPKDLGFIAAFLLRKWEYHKDEATSASTLEEYYRYNAKDSFSTAMCLLALTLELPEWARANYIMEFPLVFPCVLAELTGLRADTPKLQELKQQVSRSHDLRLSQLRKMVACSNFNPSSSQQTVRLFVALGSEDIKSSGKTKRDKVMARHPLNKRILTEIGKYREDVKLYGTYLDEQKIWHNRIFFSLNPHGTDTGRLASKESQFWCGLQIQNIPRDKKEIRIKDYFIADEGFYFGEADYEQNEARGTAYLSGDTALISAVQDTSKDFHSHNASQFFGVPYEDVDKELRDLSKRTNHGSNYNMGPGVLLDTMGIENVLRAKRLLKLPQRLSLLGVTQYLLNKYEQTYPVVKGPWYDKCRTDVCGSGFLIGPTGWHRRCFGNPAKNKRDLNAYVAHPPQSLAAMVLNKAYLGVFYNVALPNRETFKLGPQIHDSILFQYRIGYQHLAQQVAKEMDILVSVRDTFGISRVLRVPVALKGEAKRWSEIKSFTPEGFPSLKTEMSSLPSLKATAVS